MPFEHERRTDPTTPNLDPQRITQANRLDALRGVNYQEGAAALRPSNAVQLTPTEPTFGEVAAGHARDMDEKQSRQIDETGEGDYTGSQSGERGKKVTSCIGYVLDILKMTFASVGKSADWDRVRRKTYQQSGAAGIKGTELMKVLQAELGWVGVFWAPDSKSGVGENDYSARKAKSKGSYYGINVDTDKLVTDYTPAGDRTAESDGIQRLRRVKFGILAAKGGTHMTLILSGHVYEVHWSAESDSHDLFEDAGDLADWGWGSGAIVMPAEEAAGWHNPLPGTE
jgi:hypothetical protein